ncbi:Methylenetetrahydrofolate reductase [Acetobacteraceae bacterium EV16G]|uniref:Methylenetetrahydrofolate reductase n=1 Tax=Sorlinia euscelidii TaxID=3081148 RepID=A0ABU7U177_9PROT
MTRISIELVPRDAASLRQDFDTARRTLPQAGLVNIPDLTRMKMRSWEAAQLLNEAGNVPVIPHIRAIDIAPNAPLPCVQQSGIDEILVVEGDPPADPSRPTYPHGSVDIIRRYQREAPHLKVYAAFDPYRRAPYQELEAVKRKIDAGAVGFFTQPLFDLPALELCARWLEGQTVFWGVSPVVSEKSRAYWENVNHVVFARDFDASLSANIAFAQKMLDFVIREKSNIYFMPLRIDLDAYLGALVMPTI